MPSLDKSIFAKTEKSFNNYRKIDDVTLALIGLTVYSDARLVSLLLLTKQNISFKLISFDNVLHLHTYFVLIYPLKMMSSDHAFMLFEFYPSLHVGTAALTRYITLLRVLPIVTCRYSSTH